ncbi:kinase-like domain-containing protein [Syncephalastrum racemosum]|uniref:Kinase-like domain-containing protein n=1 Tax=Syncephalastrum racemosum TaxID=13706 RepID=A0A1X2HI84_SYNRA|nr:kinase-like domain-containing protein [Syncephalastrum racemosum]
MASALASSKQNREPDWQTEFYKNGYPKEIIVIEDTPPLEQNQASLASYKVIPTATHNTTAATATTAATGQQSNTIAGPSQNRQTHRTKRGRYDPPPPDNTSSKRRRKQYVQPLHNNNHGNNNKQHHDPATFAQQPPLPTAPIVSRKLEPCDDKDGHYIVRPGDYLTDRYQVYKQLGQGTYGKVVECYDHVKRTVCAIKIIRAIQKYKDASYTEIRVLNTLKEKDPLNLNQCIHLLEWFEYRNHVCMVFDLLDQSVFDFLRDNHFTPFPIHHIQHFAKQLLSSVAFMHDLKMIHTDLKPENILLKNNNHREIPLDKKRGSVRILQSSDIILIDFGSATFEDDYHSTVVSTRHYRAPEIILGLGWSYPCDIWSIGCILVEFFTGEALFQTHDNLEHLAMMEGCLGRMPSRLIAGASREAAKFFLHGRLNYPNSMTTVQSQKYVNDMRPLKNMIPVSKSPAHAAFVDLLQQMLTYDPAKRITARDALRHSFFHIDFDAHGRQR